MSVSGMHCAWLHWGIDKQTESLESFLEKIGSNKSTQSSQLRYWIGTFFPDRLNYNSSICSTSIPPQGKIPTKTIYLRWGRG